MKKHTLIFPLLFLALWACEGPARITIPEVENQDPDSTLSPVTESPFASILIEDEETITTNIGEVFSLNVLATFSSGKMVGGLRHTVKTDQDTYEVLWYSNNTDVAIVTDDGQVTTVSEGETTIKATLDNKSHAITVIVEAGNQQSTNLNRTVSSLVINDLPSALAVGSTHELSFDMTFADDSEKLDVSWRQAKSLSQGTPVLTTSNNTVASLDHHGMLTVLAAGSVDITAIIGNSVAQTTLTVTTQSEENTEDNPIIDDDSDDVEDQPEEDIDSPEDPEEIIANEPAQNSDDVFLSENDAFIFNPAEDAWFGHEEFPTNILGAPVSTRTDVVSFGTGGELIIELAGYYIVDDAGTDFTIFENAFSGWTERAYVAVSEDGVTYKTFDCDPFDTALIYAGCAGVAEINYSNNTDDYLDPDLSGGDQFDLADVGLKKARFIKITDAETCVNPALCAAGSGGFDLDAMAIVNGMND